MSYVHADYVPRKIICSAECGTQWKEYAYLERYEALIAVGILIGNTSLEFVGSYITQLLYYSSYLA